MRGLTPEAFGHDPSATAAFAALPEASAEEKPRRKLKAVVIGGGTGAPVSIRTLLSMGVETSAVVAMADDGGSTGILREAAGATAPGDIRKCITAMAGDASDPLTQAFKVRFGFAENHTLGNLMIAALEVTSGGFPQAIGICEKLLDARGHVYPSTLDRVTLVAQTRDGRLLEGQAVANHSRTALRKVALRSDGDIVAYGEAACAIRTADLVVLGPGSLFTSIIPNLVVPGIVDAIRACPGVVVFVCSLADMQGETRGMTVLEHYRALELHGMAGLIDYMLIHKGGARLGSRPPRGGGFRPPASPGAEGRRCPPLRDNLEQLHLPGANRDPEGDGPVVRDVALGEGDLDAIGRAGTRCIVADLAEAEHPTWHDPVKLRHAFAEVFGMCRAEGRT